MKRLALVLVAVLSLSLATPAEAGWYTWDIDPCRPDVAWMQVQEGFRYWSRGWTNYLVPDQYVPYYRSQGWQCGWLGAPLTNKYWSVNHWEQRFENGKITSSY